METEDEDEKLEQTTKRLKQCDEYIQTLANGWACEYRLLSEDQKLFAKKAIDDILFEARLGTLNRNSVKINQPTDSGPNIAQPPYTSGMVTGQPSSSIRQYRNIPTHSSNSLENGIYNEVQAETDSATLSNHNVRSRSQRSKADYSFNTQDQNTNMVISSTPYQSKNSSTIVPVMLYQRQSSDENATYLTQEMHSLPNVDQSRGTNIQYQTSATVNRPATIKCESVVDLQDSNFKLV